jgi:ATP-dependent DNA helicase RecG
MASLTDPLRSILGAKTATALAEGLSLRTVGDLLRHYPRRYEERGKLTDLSKLRLGEHVTVLAEVAKVSSRPMRQRRGSICEVIVTDGTGRLTLTFFGKGAQRWRADQLQVGREGLFAGKVSQFRGRRQLAHPAYVLVDDAEVDAETFAGALIPVYPATERMDSWKVGQAVTIALDVLDLDRDPLPAQIRLRQGLASLRDALHSIHRPSSRADVDRARRRLMWDEAFTLQVVLARRRAEAGAEQAEPRRASYDGLLAAFDERLPFRLTGGQRQVGEQLAVDLAGTHPMHRLLQGEVGSGKTVVALRAMLAVVDAGGQAALLAPTEVLAHQHARSIRALLGPLGRAGELGGAEQATRVALVTGSQGVAARREAAAAAVSGEAGIVVGTHALLFGGVEFRDLGLLVVDEQHRFGVEQRDALLDGSARRPHLLVMTATPIPRTVAMTVYGDLETSALIELPGGRAGTSTFVVPDTHESWRRRMWGRVRDEVTAGRQAYVVCPRIGADEPDAAIGSAEEGDEGVDGVSDDEGPPASGVVPVAAQLAAGELAGLRVAALHGRMAGADKDDVMRRFAAGELDVVVATTVIEVGVDVPNATVMVVLDAEHFGVSQLHQLRGRVGRGSQPGWCLLHTRAAPDSPAAERLRAIAASADGFALARLDLEQRREGNVLGTEQSGRRSRLRLLSLLRDEDVIRAARDEAIALVDADGDLAGHPALADEVAAFVADADAEYLQKS